MRNWQNHIEINRHVMLGKPVIRGTRVTVEVVLEHLSRGESVEQVLVDYPTLTREDVLAALAYARHAIGTNEFIHVPTSAAS